MGHSQEAVRHVQRIVAVFCGRNEIAECVKFGSFLLCVGFCARRLPRASGDDYGVRHDCSLDNLAKKITHDFNVNFNEFLPLGKADTAKELWYHPAKSQDTLADAI